MASNMTVVENDDSGTVEINSNFADDREKYPYISDPKLLNSISTGPVTGPAKEEKIGRKLFLDTVKARGVYKTNF